MIARTPSNGSGEPPPRVAAPCVMVIFGAGGDLTKRKLFPALMNLAAAKLLPEAFAIIGFAINDLNTESFRAQLTSEIKDYARCELTPELWAWFLKRIYYIRADFSDAAAYQQLKQEIAKAEKTHNIPGNHFYYLAVAPQFFGPVVRQLGAAGLAQESNGRWARVVIEKPFGRDLESAKALNREIKQVLEEPQIYRIDHYLGKETVQNIIIFRFANGIFEPIWNRRYIDHVQITAGETVGVEQRGGYYETAGALRDMVPNHLFQLVSLTAMEPPISFHADSVRDEQAKALHAIQIPTPEEVLTMAVRGQYGAGAVGDERVVAYRSEPNVQPDSTTETFAGLKLRIDNWRWADVPFYLRTGKRLPTRMTEIAVMFQRAPHLPFDTTDTEELGQNALVIRVQPDEGVTLRFGSKVPGSAMEVRDVNMDFAYGESFTESSPEAYERLLLDVLIGDPPLFPRQEEVELSWQILDPIEEFWAAHDKPEQYPAGTSGPAGADAMMARDGRAWRRL